MTSLAAAAQTDAFDNAAFAFDHLEFWVGNAKQAAHFYCSALGFEAIAYAGPETGRRDVASYVLAQNAIRVVLTTPLGPSGPLVESLARHGDAVRDVALSVPDAAAAHDHAVANGARSVATPAVRRDEHGEVVTATIAAYGDTVHTFVERRRYGGVPGVRLGAGHHG